MKESSAEGWVPCMRREINTGARTNARTHAACFFFWGGCRCGVQLQPCHACQGPESFPPSRRGAIKAYGEHNSGRRRRGGCDGWETECCRKLCSGYEFKPHFSPSLNCKNKKSNKAEEAVGCGGAGKPTTHVAFQASACISQACLHVVSRCTCPSLSRPL